MKKSSDSMDPQEKLVNEKEKQYNRVSGHLVILYIFIGVICGAAVGTAIFLIRRSRWMKKSSDSVDPQLFMISILFFHGKMDHPRPHHNTRKACDVTENVYENATMNHPRPHHDRRKVCDVTEPVYENVTMNHSRPHHGRHCDVNEPVYENVRTSAGKASESGDAENASVQDGRDIDAKKPEEEEIEYASITIHHLASKAKSAASQEDVSVIYSSLK
ncbi:B-cell receptor CD22-like protein [Labeo rohita]|uniref:B-cell receptor CD22-like protein n=1 Tax=Labeo rohita TaxID=84645 RepID=A0A498MGR8_LABRO|nr:B-cell receptor CD22-like protein [Labeo rohita]